MNIHHIPKKHVALLLFSCSMSLFAQENLTPLTQKRVDIQSEAANPQDIIDHQWVAVGIKRDYAIQQDNSLLFNGKPSYRFELKEKDNTLSGYAENTTKGRAELSYCYATVEDFSHLSPDTYAQAQLSKTVYDYGKGIAPQGSEQRYTFSIYVPDTLSSKASTIFAQWHGMPDRRLVQTPDGIVKKLSTAEFAALDKQTVFKKNIGYQKIPLLNQQGMPQKDASGQQRYKAGKPNGWLIEQGGYPPLAFGFSGGWFYIKANSDRKWFSDKADRHNINPQTADIMQSVQSKYKISTLAYKMPFADFPKNRWVTFQIDVLWSRYGKEQQTLERMGHLDVVMKYGQTEKHLVNHQTIAIGRNDEQGYYFKFGIYRVGNSTVPVSYNLAGFSMQPPK